MSLEYIDSLIKRERYEAARYRFVKRAREAWESRVRRSLWILREVEGRRLVRLKEWERILYEQPWYIRILYVRHRRLATLLIIVEELLRALRVRRRFAPLALRLLEWAVWRYRLTRWGEAEWKAYQIEMMRFLAMLYDRIVDRILREASAVVPLFRVYFSQVWTHFEHEWLSRTLASLAPSEKAELLRALPVILKRGLTWEQIQRMYPRVAAILEYVARRELGLDFARKFEIVLIPKFFEEAFGTFGAAFFMVVLPRKYASPDPYIGATEPPPVQHWDYIWKDELEPVPVKTPYHVPESIPLLFDELGTPFYSDDWRTMLVGMSFHESMVLGSHGLWERVGYALARGFFGTVYETFGPYYMRRRGAYYLIRTILHHLGLR